MFIKSTVKGAGIWNAIILIVILVLVFSIMFSLLKLKKDPKNAEGFVTTLGLGKKKAA